jgi:PilZ domain
MERRTNHRYQVWVPVKVDALREGIAVTHDASNTGVLMVTASTLEPGAPVTITLRTPDKQQTRRLNGKVVRVEVNTEDPHGLWPHRMAIEFEEPVPDLEWMLSQLTSEQA